MIPAEASEPQVAFPQPLPAQAPLDGATVFVHRKSRRGRLEALGAAGALVVSVEIRDTTRGRLADVVDLAIEDALTRVSGRPPGILDESPDGTLADRRLSDQLFRLRAAGRSGLVISLSRLAPAATPMGALEAIDSAIVRFYGNATRERPVVLLLDARDRTIGAYADPVPLHRVLAAEPDAEPAPASTACVEPGPIDHGALDLTGVGATVVAPLEDDPAPASAATPVPSDDLRDDQILAALLLSDEPAPGAAARVLASPQTVVEAPTPVPIEEPREIPAVVEPPAAPRPRLDVAPWVDALTPVTGPQPLGHLEALFTSAYVPLSHAIAIGDGDLRAERARDTFRESFTRAYEHAFPTLSIRARRPRMVMDAHAVAHQAVKSQGARATSLLLVDGMRWDVGIALEQALASQLGASARVVERTLLWAALPTTTKKQLDTLARGAEALHQPASMDEDADSLRGRGADVIRRMRVAGREVCKLDLLRSRLTMLSGCDPAAIEEELARIAGDMATTIARFARTLPPRTLLFVFGDHGFRVDPDGHIHEGGASPEEVLVPAFGVVLEPVN